MAEGEGFEPPVAFRATAVFKTARFDRSRIPPREGNGWYSPSYNSRSAPSSGAQVLILMAAARRHLMRT